MIDEKIIQKLKQKISQEKVLSFVISQDESIAFEYYKNKKMEESLQTINSCTKSILSILIGIALDNKLIQNLDIPIVEFFPQLSNYEDERKQKITIRHLLSMTEGMDWPEFGAWNFFAPMNFSKDMIHFIFDRPLINNLDEKMNYNSGCSHLLSAIIQKVSKMKTHDFAKKYLFEPLGINNTIWHEKQGVSLGSDGLRILTLDLIKIGNMLLNFGKYQNHQIVSKSWIEYSTKKQFMTYKNIGYYGYHWWVDTYHELDYYFALGYGGQFLIMVPKHKLVIAITSRIYQNSLKPLVLVKETLFSSLILLS